jgi:ribosomal protein S2
MSFRDTLARILTILNGGTPPNPPVTVTNTIPKNDDSKELLALKWEKIARDNN